MMRLLWLLPGRSAVENTRPIVLPGRRPIAVNVIILENLLVIEDGIYTLKLNGSFAGFK
jgi:hypothetical protein